MSDALRREIVAHGPDDVFSRIFFEKTPHLFEADKPLFLSWRTRLAQLLKIDPYEIIIIGSAAVGFSLNPRKNLKEFDAESDVDVAVISERYFSAAWYFLRALDIVLTPMTPAQRAAVVDHQHRYIYWGCIATDRILPLLPFAVEWMTARGEMAKLAPTIGRDINFRIYRDLAALRGYNIGGIKSIKRQLLEARGE